MDTVLRDRFTQFIPLATDFSNREKDLLEDYREALELLAHPQPKGAPDESAGAH